MGDALLTYEVKAETGRIHASPDEGEASRVTLSIKVTNTTSPHQPVECQSIHFDFPKGDSPRDFFSDESEITPTAPPHWTFTQSGSRFTATPHPDTQAGDFTNTLVFKLENIKVNKQPGISEFTITEETGAERRIGTRKITLAKFPSDTATLLSYGDFVPSSIEISPQQGDPTLAEITISISNRLHDIVNCKSISFGFHQGTAASDLFADATGIATTVDSGWSIRQDGGIFTATPSTSDDGKIGSRGLSFKFSNIKVSQQAGPTTVTITEVTDVDVNNTGSLVKNLNKTPLTLEIFDFRADPPSIHEGESTVLSWSGTSGASYRIEYDIDDDTTENIAHVTGSYTIAGLKRATTFRLYAKLADKERHREFPVDVKPVRPKINLFEGNLILTSTPTRVILNWDASHSDYCKLTDNDGQLDSKADGHHVEMASDDPPSKTFTLTAWDAKLPPHSDSLDLTVNWRLKELQNRQIAAPEDYAFGQAVSADHQRVFVLGCLGRQQAFLLVFNSQTLESIGTRIPLGGMPASLVMSPDRQRIYATALNYMSILDATTLQPIGDRIDLGTTANIEVSGAGPQCVGVFQEQSGTWLSYLRKIDLDSRQPVGEKIAVNTIVLCMAVSPVSERLYLGCYDKTLRIFALDTQQFVGEPIPIEGEDLRSIAFSPDGKIIYLGRSDGNLSALNADNHAALGESINVGNYITGITVSPDGAHLYVTSDDGKLRRFLAYSVYHPAKIKSFTASDSVLYRSGDHVDVTLNWETMSADQVTLNGDVVEGNSKTVSIQQTTKFTLVATGHDDPQSAELTVTVRT